MLRLPDTGARNSRAVAKAVGRLGDHKLAEGRNYDED